ncbi:MAG TPA: hypothetical protein VK021_04600 [Flavobacteriaceae bacterium]|nr:hypothetical protein [Flavobacteriaceae bacterium]
MKKSLFVLSLIALVFTGCKNEKKQSESTEEDDTVAPTEEKSTEIIKKDSDGNTVLIGDFIYSDGAAVINGKDFIYGIVLDSMANVLTEKVKPIKQDEYDMIPVAIKGKIKPNPKKDGWDEVVEITKIINISKSKSNKEAIEINSN